MPLFYFNIRTDGVLVEDAEGGDYADFDAAKLDAEESLRVLAADQLKSQPQIKVRSIEVCDADRKMLEVVSLPEILKKVIPPQVLNELKDAPE
jgi:hypothetical protein